MNTGRIERAGVLVLPLALFVSRTLLITFGDAGKFCMTDSAPVSCLIGHAGYDALDLDPLLVMSTLLPDVKEGQTATRSN